MSKFNMGDKVRLKDGVRIGAYYNKLEIISYMVGHTMVVVKPGIDDVYVKADNGRKWYIGDDALELIGMTFAQKQEFVRHFCKNGSCMGCPCNNGVCDAIATDKTEEQLDAVIAKIDAAGLTAEDVHDDGWPNSQAYLEAHGVKPTPAEAPKGECVKKPVFRLEDFDDDKDVMVCKERWMSDRFRKFLFQSGRKWASGDSYMNWSKWSDHENSYSFNQGMYDSEEYYVGHKYIIHRFEDFEWPECENEAVNHPDHYQGEHECIDVMRAMFGDEAVKGFCRCNAYKYRFRADQKNGEEDLRKARWYEDYLIKMEAED